MNQEKVIQKDKKKTEIQFSLKKYRKGKDKQNKF